MNENIEKVLAVLDGFRMSDEMTYSAYSVLHDEISLLDDLPKEQEPVEPVEMIDDFYPIGDPLRTIRWKCGKCGDMIAGYFNFCPNCGRAVKWE